MYTQWQFFLFICIERKQVSSLLMPTAILRSQLKVTCCSLDLATCILQKVRDIHKRTLVGHLFSELFFELSHFYMITFCSKKHVLASVFFSVSEPVKLHRLYSVTLPALTLKSEDDSDSDIELCADELVVGGGVGWSYDRRRRRRAANFSSAAAA